MLSRVSGSFFVTASQLRTAFTDSLLSCDAMKTSNLQRWLTCGVTPTINTFVNDCLRGTPSCHAPLTWGCWAQPETNTAPIRQSIGPTAAVRGSWLRESMVCTAFSYCGMGLPCVKQSTAPAPVARLLAPSNSSAVDDHCGVIQQPVPSLKNSLHIRLALKSVLVPASSPSH